MGVYNPKTKRDNSGQDSFPTLEDGMYRGTIKGYEEVKGVRKSGKTAGSEWVADSLTVEFADEGVTIPGLKIFAGSKAQKELVKAAGLMKDESEGFNYGAEDLIGKTLVFFVEKTKDGKYNNVIGVRAEKKAASV